MSIDFDNYQEQAATTIVYSKEIATFYLLIGLANEVGELLGVFKKAYRDNNGVLCKETENKVIKEMGDVLWYVAVLAKEIGVSLSCVADTNLKKLQGRKERGTIQGSGDDR